MITKTVFVVQNNLTDLFLTEEDKDECTGHTLEDAWQFKDHAQAEDYCRENETIRKVTVEAHMWISVI